MSKVNADKDVFCPNCFHTIRPLIGSKQATISPWGKTLTFQKLYAYCERCGTEFITADTHDINLRVLQSMAKEQEQKE